MALSLNDLPNAVKSARFNELIGEIESSFFDAKNQPYRFETGNDAKREFAKDVTAFANVNGGCIIFGLATEKNPLLAAEKVTKIRLFEPSLFDADQLSKLLREWIYPCPEGVETIWVPDSCINAKGLGMVFIPPQKDSSKPFLITRTLGGSKTTEILVGLVERRLDRTDVRSVVEIHHAMRTGLNFERELLGRIEALEGLIRQHLLQTQESQDSRLRSERESLIEKQRSIDLLERMDRVLKLPELHRKRVLVLGATPLGPGELKTIFSSSAHSLRSKLEKPPQIRDGGWGIRTSSQARIEAGGLIRVQSFRRALDLYGNGCLIFGVTIDKNSLAWSDDNDLRIHPLALIESVVNFTRFYALVLTELGPVAQKVKLRLDVRNLHHGGNLSKLPSGPVDPHGWTFESKEAPSGDWSTEKTVGAEQFDSDRIAFDLVRDLYTWFGHYEESIPYTKIDNGFRSIDADAISAIG